MGVATTMRGNEAVNVFGLCRVRARRRLRCVHIRSARRSSGSSAAASIAATRALASAARKESGEAEVEAWAASHAVR